MLKSTLKIKIDVGILNKSILNIKTCSIIIIFKSLTMTLNPSTASQKILK